MSLFRRPPLSSILRRHSGPIVVWCLACLAVGGLLRERSAIVEADGMVQAMSVMISPLEIGQLDSIEVELLQEVRRGQVLAQMSDERLHARMAVLLAEVEALRHERTLETVGRRRDEASDLRQFNNDVEQARFRILEVTSILAPDRVTLADLALDVRSYTELLANDLVSAREYERVRAEHDALAEKVAEHESLLEAARADLDMAEQRRGRYIERRPDLAGEAAIDQLEAKALSARLDVLQSRLEETYVQHEDLTLTAPFDGVVVQIAANSGQVVRPGDPILKLSSAQAEQIVVWLDERSIERLARREDLQATVVRTRDGRSLQAACDLVRIGPTVSMMPEELWPSPTRPLRGRPVLIGVPAGLDLVPGEIVTVRWS